MPYKIMEVDVPIACSNDPRALCAAGRLVLLPQGRSYDRRYYAAALPLLMTWQMRHAHMEAGALRQGDALLALIGSMLYTDCGPQLTFRCCKVTVDDRFRAGWPRPQSLAGTPLETVLLSSVLDRTPRISLTLATRLLMEMRATCQPRDTKSGEDYAPLFHTSGQHREAAGLVRRF